MHSEKLNGYEEDAFLLLSGIQHFAFCRRQWALIHIEQQWAENVRTVEGNLMHDKAHDSGIRERRGDLLISRGMPICSRSMGVSGECDVVEFHRSKTGISLHGEDGLYRVIPVEYKRGKPKSGSEDALQLTAEAMCLEEMLCCEIPFGYLFYGETRHREKVVFSQELRTEVRKMFAEMHRYFEERFTPNVRWSKACNACSLKDVCLPKLGKVKSAKAYVLAHLEET